MSNEQDMVELFESYEFKIHQSIYWLGKAWVQAAEDRCSGGMLERLNNIRWELEQFAKGEKNEIHKQP